MSDFAASLSGRLFVWLQYLLPQHAVSRLVLAATRVRTPWFKNFLIRGFCKLYAVDLQEAAEPDALRYASFNEFFTRALRVGARPMPTESGLIVSPVDGTVSECGLIQQDLLMQAKNQSYTLGLLLANQPWAQEFVGGSFATIYLAPYNYHRIHMPLKGRLRDTVYVPGRLFSVNAVTAQHVPGLFARNERILTLFDSDAGPMALVMVGALNVGSMATVWAGDITPAKRRKITQLPPADISLEAGAEMGRFNMGSTVILLFGPQRADFSASLTAGVTLRLGQVIGRVRDH